MSSRKARHNRDWILQQYNAAPNELIQLKGYLNIDKPSNWITFTQIENQLNERISGHINLPKHKVAVLFPDYHLHNHKPFLLTGKPDVYHPKGTKRGCLILTDLKLISQD